MPVYHSVRLQKVSCYPSFLFLYYTIAFIRTARIWFLWCIFWFTYSFEYWKDGKIVKLKFKMVSKAAKLRHYKGGKVTGSWEVLNDNNDSDEGIMCGNKRSWWLVPDRQQQQACLILSYITAPYLHDSKFRKAAEKNGTFYNVLPDLEDGIQDAAFKVRMRRLLQKAIYRL